MSLLSISTELRLRIYDYIPDLQPERREDVTICSKLTPSICRVNQLLRHETIPIFAHNSLFAFQLDDAAPAWSKRIDCWTAAFSSVSAIHQVRSVYLSRHWKIPQPMRWQGHVGFYVKVERPKRRCRQHLPPSRSSDSFPAAWSNRFVKPMPVENGDETWTVTTGTYPVSKDMRGMRLESVELLAQLIRTYLSHQSSSEDDQSAGLTAENVKMFVGAMDVVASHPISTYDLGQGESDRQRRRETWDNMRDKLYSLMDDGRETMDGVEQRLPRPTSISGRFYTPY